MENIATYSLSEVSELLGVSSGRVRRLLEDQVLAGITQNGETRVPQDFFIANKPLASLRGTLTLLADSGCVGDEALDWLFTPNEHLGSTPVAALRAGHKAPVRRAATLL